ncbi:hypothetical protein EV360DRAFT_71697 [Lentinula raphanica]|nr:hypothetical protein EV360DRAFT_71697 [Lentinula raphanica]
MFCTVYKHHFTIHEGGPDEAVIGYDFSDFYTKVSTTEAYLCCIATAPEWASDLREFQLGAYNVLWDVQYVGEASAMYRIYDRTLSTYADHLLMVEGGGGGIFCGIRNSIEKDPHVWRKCGISPHAVNSSSLAKNPTRPPMDVGKREIYLPNCITIYVVSYELSVNEELDTRCKVFWLSFYDHPWLFPLLVGLDYQKLAVFRSYRVAQVIVLRMYDSNAYAVCNAEAKTLQTTIDAVLD